MRQCFRDALAVVTAAWFLAACQTVSHPAAAPTPESEQIVSGGLKELYMRVSTAPPHSPQQLELILNMAREAANGKELLLVMRAAEGVFASAAASPPGAVENQVHSTVTAKMMQFATLEQLIDYAVEYPVDAEHARRFAERLFELGNATSDARVWYRIKAAAYHLGVNDLERQAQARADDLASR